MIKTNYKQIEQAIEKESGCEDCMLSFKDRC